MKCGFFFSIAATLRVQSARWMWRSSPVSPCCRRVWCVAGLPLATHLFLLSAEAGISAVYVRPSGLQDRRRTLVMVPASLSWTCGHWVSCGPCVVSWPQPADTDQGSGSRPCQFAAPGLLWWGFWTKGTLISSSTVPHRNNLMDEGERKRISWFCHLRRVQGISEVVSGCCCRRCCCCCCCWCCYLIICMWYCLFCNALPSVIHHNYVLFK